MTAERRDGEPNKNVPAVDQQSTTLPNLAVLLHSGPQPPSDAGPHLDIDDFLSPRFPAIGEALGDYVLLAELGRGAVGRVYLASEQGIAGRPVVLKVTQCTDAEYLSLGRLQHTHIIPLHSVRDFPDRNLRALCQPYFGGASLNRILAALAEVSPVQRTGQRLIEALDRSSAGPPLPLPESGGPRARLRQMPYVDAICWIGSCLAEALHHAHERGMVHLDIKPSNVLLAGDGQPLLLDFHLAHAAMSAGQKVPLTLGGTPGYMSPEQRAAYDAVYRARTLPHALDRRSDLYSLGRLLYVALGGNDKESIDDVPLRRRNPNVSRGLEDILRRCLKTEPADRYPSGAELASDLRRHLADQPLRGVPNRSLIERWRKWRRRRPFAPLWGGLALALVALPIFAGGIMQERVGEARESLHTGWEQYKSRQYAEAARTFSRGKLRVAQLPGCTDLREHLDLALVQAERAASADQLHAVADRLRFMVGSDMNTRKELEDLDARLRDVWDKRSTLAGKWPLDREMEERIRIDLADVACLRTDLAHRLDPNSPPLAAAPEVIADVRTDEWWLRADQGRRLMREGKNREAAAQFAIAVGLRPQDFWVNFYSGVCAYRERRWRDAVNSFNVAVALAPDTPEVRYNRALAHAAAGDHDLADRDLERAIALNPPLANREGFRRLGGR
jgi:serine/threonine protein kinase